MSVDISKYHVDFTKWLDRDQSGNAIASSLDQFRDKHVYGQVLQAFIDEANEAYKAIVELGKTRNIAFASGVWLDGIGRIVGQHRETTPSDLPENWWYMDSDSGSTPASAFMDDHVSWVSGATISIGGAPTDNDYRDQIVRRIFQNINKDSSIPEITNAIKDVLGVDVKIEQTATKTIKFYVPAGTPEWIKYSLTARSFVYSDKGYNRWYFPFPAGISVDTVVGVY